MALLLGIEGPKAFLALSLAFYVELAFDTATTLGVQDALKFGLDNVQDLRVLWKTFNCCVHEAAFDVECLMSAYLVTFRTTLKRISFPSTRAG
ncbi:hypothetical protein BDZ89DRAFT_1139305 [Hymenopellis radicata]|nr:hypothetical protein BDZ89DRAFT_1139305 [Hymenopellis radicata]